MLYQAQVTIASTGTAVALSATRQSATWVQIQSYSANNTAGLTVGGITVKPTIASGATPGVVLAPSGIQFLPAVSSSGPYNLQNIFVNGTTGDIANVLYFKK